MSRFAPPLIGDGICGKGFFVKFLFLEPFYGGSHRDFADGLVSETRHHIDLMTMPARFWKWRMRGAALYFIKKIKSLSGYDGLIVTDLMSLSDFKTLCGAGCPPVLAYFHENQITYPIAPGEHRDYQFGFTDITTALAADRVLFNSEFHFRTFFSGLPGFIHMMPEFKPGWAVDEIEAKSGIQYPGCWFSPEPAVLKKDSRLPPLVIWNHRWEFDKNPGDFFNALDVALSRGLDFRIALLGENFQTVPKAFISAKKRYGDRIVQYGYVKSREEYYHWLSQGDIVISAATQENFGISMIEAVRHGCLPLAPNRLSYPEIIPEEGHPDFIYDNQADLIDKLIFLIRNYSQFQDQRKMLSGRMGRFAWKNRIGHYDDALEEMVDVRH